MKIRISTIVILCFWFFIIGIGAGMYWRYAQVEPRLNSEIDKLQRMHKERCGELASAKARLAILEKRMKAVK